MFEDLAPVVPWLVGFVGLLVGLPIVGGDSYWLFAFAYGAVAATYWVTWP